MERRNSRKSSSNNAGHTVDKDSSSIRITEEESTTHSLRKGSKHVPLFLALFCPPSSARLCFWQGWCLPAGPRGGEVLQRDARGGDNTGRTGYQLPHQRVLEGRESGPGTQGILYQPLVLCNLRVSRVVFWFALLCFVVGLNREFHVVLRETYCCRGGTFLFPYGHNMRTPKRPNTYVGTPCFFYPAVRVPPSPARSLVHCAHTHARARRPSTRCLATASLRR